MSKKPLITFLLLAGTIACYRADAQQTILLLNGKKIEATDVHVGAEYIQYTFSKKQQKKTKELDRYEVFSITDEKGTEDFIYQPADSLDSSITYVRDYITGIQAARLNYRDKGLSVSSAIAGGAANALFLGPAFLYALPIPMLFSAAAVNLTDRQVKLPADTDERLRNSPGFEVGYRTTTKNIRLQQSLKWGYISMGIGLGWVIYGLQLKK